MHVQILPTISPKTLHEQIMERAYDKWRQGKGNAWFWAQLTPSERFAVFTGNLNYQVCNGGFSQWEGNNYAAPEIVEFLKELPKVGAVSLMVGSLVQEFSNIRTKLMSTGSPSDNDEDDTYAYDHLDKAYYKINDAFLLECEAHLKKLEA